VSLRIRLSVILVAGLLLSCSAGHRAPTGWIRVYSSYGSPVNSLVQDPDDPDVIFAAGGWQNVGETRQVGGVLRSDDRGRRWREANYGLPAGSQVLSLAVTPAGFASETPSLLAGTRSAGLFISVDGGSSWRQMPGGWDQLTVWSVIGLAGEPPAAAIGTEGYGVFVSEDGGETWLSRNQGLGNLSVKALAVDPDGNLLAATWYGGAYRSPDRGKSWFSLSQELERTSLACLTTSADGSIWLGLQNAGLWAYRPPVSGFEQQAMESIGQLGVRAIATVGDLMVVGTSGRGVAIGPQGGPFELIDRGLDNQMVLAVLIMPNAPQEIVVGTWSGLYRSIPSRSQVGLVAVVSLVAATGLGLVILAWRRSVRADAWRAYRTLCSCRPDESVRTLFEQVLVGLKPDQIEPVMLRLAARLETSSKEQCRRLANPVRSFAPLSRLASEVKNGDNVSEATESLARAAEALAAALEMFAAGESSADNAAVARLLALQDRIISTWLRADSLAHVICLRGQLESLTEAAEQVGLRSALDHHLAADLIQVLDSIEQLNRLPGAEDRALFLGQALSQSIAAQERAEERRQMPIAPGTTGIFLAFDSLCKLLTTAMQDIHQRAELVVELRSKAIRARREAVVVLEIRNVGQGHAQNIVVHLQSGGDAFNILQSRHDVKSLLRNQSARLEFLVEPQVSDRVRLSFQIAYDDQVRKGHMLEFADVVELYKITTQQTFQPLRPNPYVVGRPLLEADFFMGRRQLFREVASALRGAHQDNVVVLIGQRRMGKTSILRRLPRHLGDAYMPVLIDLQGLLSTGEAAFFCEIAEIIYDELVFYGCEVTEPSRQELERDPGGYFRRHFLAEVCRGLGSRRLLLLFDELEVLEQRIRSGALSQQILPYFRSLMQHEEQISFIFAGTHRLDELTSDYWAVLFNLAIYFDVGYLDRPEVDRLFTEPTAGYFEFDQLALDKAFQLTGGHPHFSQLVARELVELRNHELLDYITVQDMNRIAETVVEKGRLHISYLWEGATRSERLLLLTLCELLSREGLATVSAAHAYLKTRSVEPGDLPTAADSLIRREILYENGGLLTFRIELLRRWLGHHKSLESFTLAEGREGKE
jgi:photosystem II stability/assembly factor-like uncharacterized protein